MQANPSESQDVLEIKNWREFEKGLAALGSEIRNLIELDCSAFSTDKAASKERRTRAWNDYQFFCQTYFPHYVPTPHFSQFHEFIFKYYPQLIDGARDARDVIEAPRGEAKSTYCTQLGSLWCIVTGRKHMIGIIMNTEEQAAEMLESIKAELDTNPRLRMDFPESWGVGRVWQSTTAITANNIKIRIGGTGKKIRGMKHGPYRPDLIFLDDLENDENVKQKEQRDKTQKYVLSAVLGLAPPSGGMDVIWVGTSLHYDAAINRVSRKPGWRRKVFKSIVKYPDNMKLWEQWEAIYNSGSTDDDRIEAESDAHEFYLANKAEMDQGAIVSWPQVRDLYRLMCMRAIDHDAFSQEQQNESGNDDNAPFKNIQFWVNRLNDWMFFGSVDPSLGKKSKKGDPSAILVGGLNRNTMTLDVVEADIRRRVPDIIISDAINYQKEYNCIAWAIETVQFQAFMYTELIKRAALEGVAFPGIPIDQSADKELRIMSLQPHVKNGLIRLHHQQTTMKEQLQFYPEADHDDGPDALEMLWSLAKQFSATYEYHSAASSRKAARGSQSNSFEDDWNDDD